MELIGWLMILLFCIYGTIEYFFRPRSSLNQTIILLPDPHPKIPKAPQPVQTKTKTPSNHSEHYIKPEVERRLDLK